MNYFLATATATLILPISNAFISVRRAAFPIVPHTQSKTCIFQQQQLFDHEGNPIYDQYGNPMYYDPQQQQYYDQGQQMQQPQYYDQQQPPNEPDQPSLIISDNMQEEMARATSGVEAGGLDYLALARQRAAARVDSNNAQSTAEDWFEMAEAKKRELGGVELKVDWENWDPADAELDEKEAAEGVSGSGDGGVPMEEYGGGTMITEGGLVVDNVDGEDGPQLLI